MNTAPEPVFRALRLVGDERTPSRWVVLVAAVLGLVAAALVAVSTFSAVGEAGVVRGVATLLAAAATFVGTLLSVSAGWSLGAA